MRKCPFCKKDVVLEQPYMMYLPNLEKYSFHHSCNDNVSILITADTVDEIVMEWNGSV